MSYIGRLFLYSCYFLIIFFFLGVTVIIVTPYKAKNYFCS
nr:MAG TPA: hypothetical protein [Bacteriophage sp.]